MQKNRKIFSVLLMVLFVLNVTEFKLPHAYASSGDGWEDSLAYGKSVSIMQGTVHSNGALGGLVDGDAGEEAGKFLRVNSNGIGDGRWTWFEVDLGDVYEVNYFKVFTHKLYNASPDSYIDAFRIEGSEDGHYYDEIIPATFPAAGGSFPHTTMVDFASAQKFEAQYIRIWLKIAEQQGEQVYVPALREFGVYNLDNPQITYTSVTVQAASAGSSQPPPPVPVLNGAYASVPADVAGTPYEAAADRLMSLNIMSGYEDGMFKPENAVTRAEFAVIITKIQGYSEIGSVKQETPFSDVPASHWASGYINTAARTGIINGYGDGAFGPDEPVSYEQTLKMVVSTLGYDLHAMQRGGYPTGYVITATELRIIRDISENLSGPAKRGAVAQIVCNALNVDIMAQTGFGSEPGYAVSKGKTLLTEMLETHRKTGQITAAGISALAGNSNLRDDEVRIGDRVFKAGDTPAKSFIGYVVNYFYYEDKNSGEYILTYVQPIEGWNNVLTISADDINRDRMTRDKLVYYDENGRETTADIHASPYVLYNGKATGSFSDDDLKPLSGMVKLLSANNSGSYNIVFITEYDIYLVDAVNTAESIIYDQLGGEPLALDGRAKSSYVSIIKEGQEIEVNGIHPDDVLSVAKSRDGMAITVIVSDIKASGNVEEIIKDGEKITEIVIGGSAYKISPLFSGDIKIYDSGTFYLDHTGVIVAADTSVSVKGQYGYLMNMVKESGISGTVQLRIFSENGRWETFTSERKVWVNYGFARQSTDAVSLLTNDLLYEADSQRIIPQLVKFRLNGNGDVAELFIAKDNTSREIEYGTEYFTIDGANVSGRYSTNYLGRHIKISAEAVVFAAPPAFEEEQFGAYKSSSFFVNNRDYASSLNIMVYDLDDMMEARAVVVGQRKELVASLSTTSTPAVIERIAQGINDEGEDVLRFYVLENGSRKSITTDRNTVITNMNVPSPYNSVTPEMFRKGDVIQYAESGGMVESYRVLYHTGDPTERLIYRGSGGAASTAADLELVYGTLHERLGNRISVRYGEETLYYDLGSELVYVFDSKRDIITTAAIGEAITEKQDAEHASKVLVHARRNAVRTMIIYK